MTRQIVIPLSGQQAHEVTFRLDAPTRQELGRHAPREVDAAAVEGFVDEVERAVGAFQVLRDAHRAQLTDEQARRALRNWEAKIESFATDLEELHKSDPLESRISACIPQDFSLDDLAEDIEVHGARTLVQRASVDLVRDCTTALRTLHAVVSVAAQLGERRPAGGRQKEPLKLALVRRVAESYRTYFHREPGTGQDGPFAKIAEIALREARMPLANPHALILKAVKVQKP